MKVQVAQKQVLENSSAVIRIGYCGLQRLLKFKSPAYYTAGVYGWNADIYDMGAVKIVTGYRPFGTVKPPYQLVKHYDDKAGAMIERTTDTEQLKNALDLLINEFVEAVLRNK